MPAHAAGTWEGRAVRMYTGTVATAGWDEDGAALSAERARLVRLCARLTGDAQAAEDRAQDTLLVAFQRERALRDPASSPSSVVLRVGVAMGHPQSSWHGHRTEDVW